MPKRIFGCTNCFDEKIELQLIKMIPDDVNPELFMTTYRCPNCGQNYYEMHNENQTAQIPDEFQPVDAAKQAKIRYSKKLEIYKKLKTQTNEDKIMKLKQDEFYDPDFDPETTELY